MDTYEQINAEFDRLALFSDWNEMRLLFNRVASTKPFHWMLPVWACKAVGSLCDQALYAAVAIAYSQTNIIQVGVLLDGDPRGEYQLVGEAAAAYLACAFQAAGTLAIGGSF